VDRIVVEGGVRLEGTVEISGAKNAVLPIMASALLADGPTVIDNPPDVKDVRTLLKVLVELGIKWEWNGTLVLEVVDDTLIKAPYELVSQMRASVCVLGPLLAKRGRALVSLPGGCLIGVRPIDLHRKGIEALNATTRVVEGYVVAETDGLRGANVYLGGPFGPTVLGTANTMMAASLASGVTTIQSAACEPEVEDLARYINKMGGAIEGAGSPILRIRGVRSLRGVRHSVIPDRIEAATFMIAAAITHGDVTCQNVRVEHLGAIIDTLRRAGAEVIPFENSVRVIGPEKIQPVDVTSLPYPGVPTDCQAQLMALMSIADGISVVTEKIYPDRFMHVAELMRMGANLRKEGPSVIVKGVPDLSGAKVMASDLRASASLIIAGLVAEGKTDVGRVYHLDRGYERIEEKFRGLGANVYRYNDGAKPKNKPEEAPAEANV